MTDMFSLLEIETGASEVELENAYKGKRQRYLMEIKSTSAKPRIRLLEDKLAKLESAYKEYAKQPSMPKLKEESINQNTETKIESGGGKGAKSALPSPDSLSLALIYPLIAIDGKLIKTEIRNTLNISVNERPVSIKDDGSIKLENGINQIRIEHPDLLCWEKTIHARGAMSVPVAIDLSSVKCKFALNVTPRINFKVFKDGWELPRSVKDEYEIPLFRNKSIIIKADGYEDQRVSLDNLSKERKINLNLCPKPEYCDLVTAQTPFTAKNKETNTEVKMISSDNFTFGRGENSKVLLRNENECDHNDLFVSREHFSIRKEENKVFLTDHSSNGTFLNGKLISKSDELTAGLLHEIEIYNPNNQKPVVRKTMVVHAGSITEDSENQTQPLFISVREAKTTTKKLTHLLLFSEFSQLRNIPQNRAIWLQKILPIISENKTVSSISTIGDELKFWEVINNNHSNLN
jgi:hypothetical protein